MIRNKTRMLIISTSIQHHISGPCQQRNAKDKLKGVRTRKEETKLLSFAHYITNHTKNPREYSDLLKLINS